MTSPTELERLREAEALYRLTIENVSDAIFVTDDAGRFVYVCPNAYVIFGASSEAIEALGTVDALLGQPVVSQLDPDVREVPNLQLRITDADGAPHVVLVSVKRARVLRGSIIVVVRDITERWRLQTQLARAERVASLDRFALGIAHDVNNLLQIIRGHSDLLRVEVARPSPLADLDSIDRALHHVEQLVGDLSAFARGDRERPAPLDVEAALAGLRPTLETAAAPHRLILSVAPWLAPVEVDPNALGRVLLNLALNAAEATPGVGDVYVQVRPLTLRAARPAACGKQVPPGAYVAIEVSDAGVGMAPEVAERVFEPYFTTKDRENGGIGLASSLSLVRAAGGYMAVTSALGAGTTVSVFLPTVDPPG